MISFSLLRIINVTTNIVTGSDIVTCLLQLDHVQCLSGEVCVKRRVSTRTGFERRRKRKIESHGESKVSNHYDDADSNELYEDLTTTERISA